MLPLDGSLTEHIDGAATWRILLAVSATPGSRTVTLTSDSTCSVGFPISVLQ